MGLELYDLPFCNNSGETAPPFAVMQVDDWKDDVNDRDYFRIVKPTSSGKLYLVNGPIPVAAGGDGMASRADGIQAGYYPGDGTPANGEEWGPESGSWELQKDKPGFVIIGDSEIINGVYTIRAAVVSAGSTLRWGQAASAITASTGWAEANWGAGTVQFYDDAGVADGAAVDVDNLYPQAFIIGEEVCVDTSFSPHLIVYASPGRVIYAQVNAPSGVGGGDSSFAFDNAREIVGERPADGTGTALNQYWQVYANDEWVLLFFDEANEDWLTERGGTAGSQVIYFELTQDKSYADDSKLAKPVDADGAIVSGADAFYIVDDQRQFFGLTATGGEEGYRGFAWKYTDDYADGVPGWRIITMEGPAHWLLATLSAAFSSEGTDCTVSAHDIWGRPFRNRRLPASGAVSVHDDNDVASQALSGDKWLIAWNEAAEHYLFVEPLERFVRVEGAASVTPELTDFSLGSPFPLLGDDPGTSITVSNQPPLLSDGDPVRAMWDHSAGETRGTKWTTADMANFIPALKGIIEWDESVKPRCLSRTEEHKLVWEALELLLPMLDDFDEEKADVQVIGHDGTKALWRDENDGGGGGEEYFAGCGLNLSGDTFSVDAGDLAGFGLSAGSGCSLDVNLGCGLMPNGDAIAVDVASLAGTGLIVSSFGICDALAVNVGCGLQILDDAVVVFASELAGAGLVAASGGGCALDVNFGCGLTIEEDVLKVATDDLIGDAVWLEPAGDCGFDVTNETTDLIKSIDEIKLVLEGGELKVKLKYTKLTSAVVLSFGGESSEEEVGSVETIDCEEEP